MPLTVIGGVLAFLVWVVLPPVGFGLGFYVTDYEVKDSRDGNDDDDVDDLSWDGPQNGGGGGRREMKMKKKLCL